MLLTECELNCHHEVNEKSAPVNLNNGIDSIDGHHVETALDDDDDDDHRVG